MTTQQQEQQRIDFVHHLSLNFTATHLHARGAAHHFPQIYSRGHYCRSGSPALFAVWLSSPVQGGVYQWRRFLLVATYWSAAVCSNYSGSSSTWKGACSSITSQFRACYLTPI